MKTFFPKWVLCASLLILLSAPGCGDSNLSKPGSLPPIDLQDIENNDVENNDDAFAHDSGDEDLDISDIPDTNPESDISDIPDTNPESDTSDIPDTNPEPDISDNPDTNPKPDPDPDPQPSWDCTQIACSAVDNATTTLGQMKKLDHCAYEMALEKPLSTGTQLADKLLARLKSENAGQATTLATVIGNMNRNGQAGLSSATKTRLTGLGASGFRWAQGDIDVDYWMPQGITGSSDAVATGIINGRKLIMMAWYHKTTERPTRGVRISLTDITDLNNVTYRHLILVDPLEIDGKANFKAAEYDGGNALHAGGIVWYGDYLYVADTAQGLRIYDLSRIFKLTHTDAATKIGITAGRSDAHGYLYAIPRIARYKHTKDSCKSRFSFVGLDRTTNPPVLTTGDYIADSTAGKVISWPLDPQTHLLETRQNTTRASEAAVIGQTRTQGALRVGSDYYFSNSSQDGSDGRLYINRPGQTSRSVKWINGTEDIYYDRQTQRLWTPSEHPGRRDVVSIPRANVK